MKKSLCLVFILLFLAVCALPGIAYLCGYQAENRENRPLARAAELVGRDGLNLSFPADFDDWWEDHFGLREEMVTAFHGLTMAVTGDTLNKKVVVGKDNFLFYAETMENYLGLNLMTEGEIARAAAVLRLVGEYAQSTGATFTFAAAPNKNTLYPEYMPERYRPTGEESNRARLYEALAKQGVTTIDFAGLLAAHKAEGLLYYRQDTHWNERGALLAYRAMMEKIAAGEAYNAYENAVATEKTGYVGDLHNFVLPAAAGDLADPYYGLTLDYRVDEGARPERDVSFGTSVPINNVRLLLFRDSFGQALIPLLSANVGRAVYSQEFPYNMTFTDESFTAVMIELVERNIPNLLLSAPLVPGVEKQAALPENGELAANVTVRQKNGYTQIAGCFDGDYPEHIYVEVRVGGASRVYEAFPILEEGMEALWDEMEAPCGFVLTLPAGIAGQATVRVAAGQRASAGAEVVLP